MARIDKGLVILVGRDRENPRTHREAFEITDGLGEMLDKHIKRNNLNKSEFIREAVAAKLEAEMLKEPLIKDEKIRKAVRAWAESWENGSGNSGRWAYWEEDGEEFHIARGDIEIFFPVSNGVKDGEYTITELCGEEDG